MKSLLHPYWILIISRRALFGLPCLFLHLAQHGVSDLSVGWCLGILAASQVLLEMPSGVFSDRLGRRKTLIIGAVCRTIGWLLFATAPTFVWFALGFCFLGAAFAFDSGTDSAWLYDSLQEQDRITDYAALEARSQLVGLASLGIANLLGGWVVYLGLIVPVSITIIPMLVSVVAAWALIEPKFHRPDSDREFWSHVWRGLRAIHSQRRLCKVISLSAIIVAGCEVYFRFIQQFLYASLHIAPTEFGYLYFAWLGIAAVSARLTPKLLARFSPVLILELLVAAGGCSLILLGGSMYGPFLIFTIVMQMCYGIVPVVLRTDLNKSLQSSVRATIFSVFGFLTSCIIVVAGPATGFFVRLFGNGAGIVAIGVGIIVGGFVAYVLSFTRPEGGGPLPQCEKK